MKYHIITTIINFVLIVFILKIFQEIYVLFDSLYFAKRGGYFERFFTYLLFFFSWMATLLIYKVKNYKIHYRYFIGANLIIYLVISFVEYVIYSFGEGNHFTLYNSFLCVKYTLREITAPLLVVSILVHISQNFIGKKLLPEKYKPLN